MSLMLSVANVSKPAKKTTQKQFQWCTTVEQIEKCNRLLMTLASVTYVQYCMNQRSCKLVGFTYTLQIDQVTPERKLILQNKLRTQVMGSHICLRLVEDDRLSTPLALAPS